MKPETIRRSVYNGVTLESEPGFAGISVPVVALAGGREQKAVIDSVKRMAELNPNCRYQIWDRAAHNIPPVFAANFNRLITETADKASL